jgi:hypothetical protein
MCVVIYNDRHSRYRRPRIRRPTPGSSVTPIPTTFVATAFRIQQGTFPSRKGCRRTKQYHIHPLYTSTIDQIPTSNMSTTTVNVQSQTELIRDLKKRYILPHTRQEIERMQNQHEWVKACAKGLVKAPLDFERRDLRVLDSATADGELCAPSHPQQILTHRRILDHGSRRGFAEWIRIRWLRHRVSSFLPLRALIGVKHQGVHLRF